jgi:UDP-glucuronate decarboxylase
VTGLIALMASDFTDPVNIGSEAEATVYHWATLIRDTVEEMRDHGEIPPSVSPREEGDAEAVFEQKERRRSEIVFTPAVVDDPPRRRPDITRAREVLVWEPTWTIKAGVEETIRYFAAELGAAEY